MAMPLEREKRRRSEEESWGENESLPARGEDVKFKLRRKRLKGPILLVCLFVLPSFLPFSHGVLSAIGQVRKSSSWAR